MTSEEPIDGSKETNDKEKHEENEPKRSFRAEYARKSHNTIEKKRKDKIAIWINKISELLPKDPKKESKNAILEKAFHYMVHLKEMNDKLIYGNADQIIGEELRLAKRRIKKLEDTNGVYYKLLKMSGITPTNIPLDVMNPNPLKNTKSTQESSNSEKTTLDPNISGDEQSDGDSDTTEDHNAPRISLSNGSQLQIRPSPNVQILGNGALAIDSSGFNQGPIILGSTLLSPPQPTTLVMHNGQLLSLVNQPQPAFVYTPGSGFVLTSSTPINSTSINVPPTQAKSTEQTEKCKRKVRSSTTGDQEKSPTESGETARIKRPRTYQKPNVNIDDSITGEEVQATIPSQQQQETISLPPKKKRGRPLKVTQQAKETTDKLPLNEVTPTPNGEAIAQENDKRQRLTTVIERVADSPSKRCIRTTSKANKGTTTKELTDELTETDLETENYSFRQNGDATCEQDQLPLLLGSLSEDHEMSTDSVHSVSNSSLPTFLSLSPSDHLTDFLSKTSDHGNGTTRSPRYSSPMNRINTNTSNSQTPSVIMSNQSSNVITESSNCHDGEDYANSIDQQHHHHHHHQQHHSNEQLESNSYQSNSNNAGQGRLYSTDSQEDRRRSDPSDKSTTPQSVVRKTQQSRDSSSSTSAQQTSTGNTNLDSSAPPSSSSTNNPTTTNQLLPYSAESLLRQQPQQSNTNNMPTSVPINSIYHVQSNVSVDSNIEFTSRDNSASGNSANNTSARPTISYSAERLIHTPPGESNQIANNNSSRQKSHEPGKVNSIPGNNNSTSNNQASNIFNEQYSIIRTARGSADLDSDLSRLQSAHHHQHHHQHQQQQQQQQHATNMYRSSPQAHDQRANQDHSSRTGNTNLNVNSQSNQQQIMNQQRNSYSENHHHQQQPPPPPPPTQQTSQQPRGQSHQSTQPNQSNSSSQGQINLKTTSTSASNSSPTSSSTNNPVNNNGRELFNHHYPYGSSEGSTSERNANLMNFSNSGNGHNEGFIENNSSSGMQNNFLAPFPPNSNCQPPFGPPNNRRSSNSSAAMLSSFNFADPSFTTDPYNRQAHGASGNASNSAINFADGNRRIGNPGHFVDHTSATGTSNNPTNNYFMVHNHHVSSSSLPNSNNPPIFSTSSSFPSLISGSSNSNYDNNGYNLTCPSRSSATSINTTTNISPTSNTLSNSNSNSNLHHHHSHHHPTFYSEPGVTTIQSMHNARRPSESPSYSGSSNQGKTTANTTNNSTVKATGNTPSTSSINSKQSGKSTGGSSSKSAKKASGTNIGAKNSRSTNTNVSNPSGTNSYSSMSSFAPPPPPPPTASAVPNHSGNRSAGTSASSSTLLNISSSSTERSSIDTNESLFRPQSQSNASTNMQPTSATSRSTGPSTHGLTPVGHSSSFLYNFNNPLTNIFAEMGSIQSINPNDNFAMSGLSAIKFNHPANVLPHHPGPNAPFAHSSTLQSSVPMENSSGSMSDNSSHQNIYGHHSRIATPHHHNPFIQLIGSSPRTLK
ncbi:GATA zinc finger domain-containing protein 14-like isoform X2 [Panonychus citri]|uniref:GATA zinc finger domain-containing protein 14-like isoform X2 n=1 Tax=Panonychus citri TaxID=50023 RepID=UPI0023082C59|nr:GATA zinc finger domain-containing protein 14-like isoform X2 [Panonychus citri]